MYGDLPPDWHIQPTWLAQPPQTPACIVDQEVCEEGWIKFQGHCYRHFPDRETWVDAESRCREQQSHLSSIVTPEEQEFVNSECCRLDATVGRWCPVRPCGEGGWELWKMLLGPSSQEEMALWGLQPWLQSCGCHLSAGQGCGRTV